MPVVTYLDQQIQCEGNESLLDALIRLDIEVPYSCKAGICQTCLLRCVQGRVPDEAQKELRPALREQGYFMACQCFPEQEIRVSSGESEQLFVSAQLISKQQLSPTVYQLRLRTAVPIYYHAGQFINIKRSDGVIRSYSLASLPSEDQDIELHVKAMPNGAMSNWLVNEFTIGQGIDIEGPVGECYYSNAMHSQPILLVGTGTGLAPIMGVLRDALHHEHQEQIKLYHGVSTREELYLDEGLRLLSDQYDNFEYYGCVTQDEGGHGVLKGRASDLALQQHPDLKGWQIFLCGAPTMVTSMCQFAYLAGAALHDIHADPFETQDLR